MTFGLKWGIGIGDRGLGWWWDLGLGFGIGNWDLELGIGIGDWDLGLVVTFGFGSPKYWEARSRHYFAISANQDLLVCCFGSCIRSCWRLPLTNPALSASRDFGFWCGNGPEGMGPGAPNAALQRLTINIFVRDFFALILQHVKTKLYCLSIYLL